MAESKGPARELDDLDLEDVAAAAAGVGKTVACGIACVGCAACRAFRRPQVAPRRPVRPRVVPRRK